MNPKHLPNNPPPLRGRAARPRGATKGGVQAGCLHAKIELCHRYSRVTSEGTSQLLSGGSGPSYDAAKLKTAAFAGRRRLAPSSSTSPALSESFLARSTADCVPGANCMTRRGLGGWSRGVFAYCGFKMRRSSGTLKAFSSRSDLLLSHDTEYKPPSLRGRSDHSAKRDDPGGGWARSLQPLSVSPQPSLDASGFETPPFCLISLAREETSSPSRGEDSVLQSQHTRP
jgi:hypothetical protein